MPLVGVALTNGAMFLGAGAMESYLLTGWLNLIFVFICELLHNHLRFTQDPTTIQTI